MNFEPSIAYMKEGRNGVFMSLSASKVISRRDRNLEPGRNSLLFTSSSKGSFLYVNVLVSIVLEYWLVLLPCSLFSYLWNRRVPVYWILSPDPICLCSCVNSDRK